LIAVGFLLLAAAGGRGAVAGDRQPRDGCADQKLVDPACKLTGGDFKVSSGRRTSRVRWNLEP
jgi:hypothetical protein